MQNTHFVVSQRTVFDRHRSCLSKKFSTLPGASIKNGLQIPGVYKFSRYRSVIGGRLKWTTYAEIRTGRFIMFSVITKMCNKKTKGLALMELFTATEKLKKLVFFYT
jgi:hypothetical protein